MRKHPIDAASKKIMYAVMALFFLSMVCGAFPAEAEKENTVLITDNLAVDYDSPYADPAQAYIERHLNPRQALKRGTVYIGGNLTGAAAYLYQQLSDGIVQIAAGSLTSTEFSFEAADVLSQTSFTKDELGVDAISANGRVTEETRKKLAVAVQAQLTPVFKSLMMDHPLELYWYNKKIGISFNYYITYDDNSISLSSQIFMSMAVAEEYMGEDRYHIDPQYGQGVQQAAANAAAIVNRCSGLTDYRKLREYKNEICKLTSYNYEAIDPEANTPYGNPWQLIWVFDGDPATKVVCEGYSKAFQYLCEISTFDHPISVTSVSGAAFNAQDGSGGGHMWNIVTMEDGKNYLVDVTNCDQNDESPWDSLFMQGYSAKSDEGYYYFPFGNSFLVYIYEDGLDDIVSPGLLELSAEAYQASGAASGSCGANVSWTLAPSGLLTISGQGDMDDFEDAYYIGGYPWGDQVTQAVIEEGVTGIGYYALAANHHLTSITIPSTVTNIRSYAFSHCDALKSVTVAQNNPNYVSVDGVLFSKDKTELILYPSARAGSFYAIPSTVITIGDEAFYACNNLTDVSIPEGVASIGRYDFAWCENLTEVTLPASVSFLDSNVLLRCGNLQRINVSAGSAWFSSIDGVLFNADGTELIMCPNGRSGVYAIPSGTTAVCDSAFFYNTKLTDITIPSSVTEIRGHAFQFCEGLTEVLIPDGVVSIGGFAFTRCSNLVKATIPASVNTIGSNAFKFCSDALTIYGMVGSEAQAYAARDGIDFVAISLEPTFFLPAGLTAIENEAFSGIAAEAVFIPSSVTTIEGNPFDGSAVQYIYGIPGTEAENFAANYTEYIFIPVDDDWLASH